MCPLVFISSVYFPPIASGLEKLADELKAVATFIHVDVDELEVRDNKTILSLACSSSDSRQQ